MSKLNLDWLNSLEVKAGEKTAKKVAVVKTPQKGDILILKNGSIYFSDELKKKLDKQYVDLVFLSEWFEAKSDQEGLLFVPVPEGSAKASIQAKSDGKVTFIKDQFIPALVEKLDVNVDELGSIELSILWNKEIKLGNGIYHFSKLTSSGKSKGQYFPLRRENVRIYPMSIILSEEETDAVQQELPFVDETTDKVEPEEITID